jgi:hypothetical protein
LSPLLSFPTGCTPAEEAAVTSDVSTALAALEGNKALSEQFVRDVQDTMAPTDPQYKSIMGAYEEAREDYNSYLSQIEMAARMGRRPPLNSGAVDGVKDSATEFISAAAKGLDPTANRKIQFRKAIILPPTLVTGLRRLPRGVRAAIADRVAADLHWKSWSTI